MRLDIPPDHEVGERASKDDSNGATDYPVEPFPEEDVLEAFEVHARVLVHLEPLWALFVLLKLLLPLLLANGRQNAMRLPTDHRQATFAQPGVASDPDDGENRGAYCRQPEAHEALFACHNEFLVFDIENDRIEVEFVLASLGLRCG